MCVCVCVTVCVCVVTLSSRFTGAVLLPDVRYWFASPFCLVIPCGVLCVISF